MHGIGIGLLFLSLSVLLVVVGGVQLPLCPDVAGAVQTIIKTNSCSWTGSRPASAGALRVASATSRLPLVLVSGGKDAATGELRLTLQRLVIAGSKLTAANGQNGPPFWPLGLYDTVGTGLNISDVRLVVDAAVLQDYLALMQTLPRAVAQYYTDGKTFVHVAAWESKQSSVHSVTLISGSCLAADASSYTDFAGALATAEQDGCNVQSVDNTTLIPTLVESGGIPTPQPLLVFITANVSLGFGLKAGSIPIHRPVVLVGLYSVPTSIDMYMVVNQLDVTSKYAKVYFLSLFIENAAPGDAVSSILSRPMSSAVSANVYAVYCDRMRNCLNLHNSTVVLASQQEMDYLNYMYSMFNSPLPNMRQATTFYHTELRCVIIAMGPGPNGVGMTLYNLTCGAWDLYNSVFTTQPAVAQRLPFPDGAPQFITAATKAGPLVQSVKGCSSLQSAMAYKTVETRLHVWMLLDSIDLVPDSEPKCWENRTIRYPTQIYGRPNEAARSAHSDSTFSLAFGYVQGALVLPDTAEARFLSIFNTTLIELPQGLNARAGASPGRLQPDIFALLLWCITRNQQSVNPVYVQDVTIWLPEPEFAFLSERAAASSSFAVQLMGDGDLTFKGTAAEEGIVTAQSLDGPGMLGTNVVLRAMPSGQLPPNYFWPVRLAAESSGSSLPPGAIAGIVLGSVGFVLLVLGGLAAVWHAKRRRMSHHMLLPNGALHADKGSQHAYSSRPYPHDGSASHCSSPKPGSGAPVLLGPDMVAIDTASTRDLLSPLPIVGLEQAGSGSRRSALLTAAAGSGATNGSAVAGSIPSVPSSSAGPSSSSDSISLGLDRWKAAISTTTMQLMERRMQMVQGGSSSGTTSVRTHSGASSRPARPGGASRAAPGGSAAAAQQQPTGLQIHQLIGQGSFGCVWLGTWHGKRVACKIMQLPATGPFSSCTDEAPAALMAQNQANSLPHMAIMEAVLSSTVSHPNVVQVYTYMLNPLGVNSDGHSPLDQPDFAAVAAADAAAAAAAGGPHPGGAGQSPAAKPYSKITGWELKLVMEWCNAGTLREALDRRVLHPQDHKYLPVESILSLCHDISAALLHLHSQGVIHGDLKAANVMLTQGGADQGSVWAAAYGHKVTAKVADFGLALPLDPSDTHATLAARTPTHMAPEIFMNGHVSKSSDIYAFGILLHELVSSKRAYAGVPIPLLPHEVAVKGLRPKWPSSLPPQYRDLQALAEACWAQEPQARPTISDIFTMLEQMEQGKPVPMLAQYSRQQEPQPQPQQQDLGHVRQGQRQQQAAQGEGQMQQQQQTSQQQQQQAIPSHNRKNMDWSEVSYHHETDKGAT